MWVRNIAYWVFQLVLVLILVFSAKSRGHTCQWNEAKVKSRLTWGVVIVAFVQVAEFLQEATTPNHHGLGLLYHIQWIGVYWIALSAYRRKYMRENASKPATL